MSSKLLLELKKKKNSVNKYLSGKNSREKMKIKIVIISWSSKETKNDFLVIKHERKKKGKKFPIYLRGNFEVHAKQS